MAALVVRHALLSFSLSLAKPTTFSGGACHHIGRLGYKHWMPLPHMGGPGLSGWPSHHEGLFMLGHWGGSKLLHLYHNSRRKPGISCSMSGMHGSNLVEGRVAGAAE